jgi:thiosulfate dehydrogenase [quinone] large subunit
MSNQHEFESPDHLNHLFAVLLLRIWLGLRALQTGIEKFGGTKASEQPVNIDGAANTYGLTADAEQKIYSFGNYHGVPKGLYDDLAGEPLIPEFFLKAYDFILGPALIILGLTVLLGILPRVSLFLMGLLYTSLTFGLILLKQDAGIAWLAIHIIMIAMALVYQRYNRFQVFKKF